jgi:hypothetical protein
MDDGTVYTKSKFYRRLILDNEFITDLEME